MKERELASIFKKSCALENLMYVDIPDSIGNVGTPCDGILNYYGKFIAIGHKRKTKYAAFHPNELRDNQIRGLDASVASGGMSMVTLMIWKARELNLMHFWEWNHFKDLTNNLTTSIKVDEIKKAPVIYCKKKQYNLANMLEWLDIHQI